MDNFFKNYENRQIVQFHTFFKREIVHPSRFALHQVVKWSN